MNIHEIAKYKAEETWLTKGYSWVKKVLTDTPEDKSITLFDFREACNAVSCLSYLRYEAFDLDSKKTTFLKNVANLSARFALGGEFSAIFDKVVAWSKQELWGGDELYKLFDFDIAPYYVKSCIKSAVWLTHRMKEPINTLEDVNKIYRTIHHPPYWDIGDDKDIERDLFLTREEKLWDSVVEMLYRNSYEEAYEFIGDVSKGRRGWDKM